MKKLIAILIVTNLFTVSYADNGHGKVSHSKAKHHKVVVNWADSILNEDNEEYVEQIAGDLGIPVSKVTQGMFDRRYGFFNLKYIK